jgi:hypothetical protein
MDAAMSSDDSKIVAHLVRMVVPMRREFGQYLDVQHFLHDLSYAQEVLRTARTSQDPRLREYADYVARLHLGPRLGVAAAGAAAAPVNGIPPAGAPMAAAADTPASTPAAERAQPAPQATEEEMRARIMKKYTSGLR